MMVWYVGGLRCGQRELIPARYLSPMRAGATFAVGTLLVNTTGSVLLGFLLR
jgi:fluoride ion exporter CrcB/FEX